MLVKEKSALGRQVNLGGNFITPDGKYGRPINEKGSCAK